MDKFGYANGCFIQNYDDDLVTHIECNYSSGDCVLKFSDGRETIIRANFNSYNSQYGVPFSRKYMRVFVSAWTGGLKCYDANTGEKLWTMKGPHYTKMFVYDDYIISITQCKAITKALISTGEIITKLAGTDMRFIYEVADRIIFVGRIRGVYCLFNTDKFEVIKKYGMEIVNPNECLSLLIQDVKIEDNRLVIYGAEQYPNWTMTRELHDMDQFVRTIDEDVSAVLHGHS